MFAGDDGAPAGVFGGVGGVAEPLPGERLAVGQDIQLAVAGVVTLLVERQEGERDGLVDRRAPVSPGDAADGLEQGGRLGRRPLDERLRRFAGEVDAGPVTGRETLDQRRGGGLGDIDRRAALRFLGHAVGGVEDDHGITPGAGEPGGSGALADDRPSEGKRQARQQQ